jgi:hypothetical protein
LVPLFKIDPALIVDVVDIAWVKADSAAAWEKAGTEPEVRIITPRRTCVFICHCLRVDDENTTNTARGGFFLSPDLRTRFWPSGPRLPRHGEVLQPEAGCDFLSGGVAI